jgi:glycosyltransferase involved in cell wall biosynthesis
VRVLVVTTVHTPLDARIHHRQIRAMVAAGWRVTYAAPFRDAEVDPSELVDGVVAVDLPRARGRDRLRALRAARRVVGRLGPRHDVVLLHDPELVGAVIGRRRGPAVVLDVHEDLVASLPDRPWVPAPLRGVAAALGRAVERWAERRLHLLLAERRYAERFDRPHPVVRNLPWAPTDAGDDGAHAPAHDVAADPPVRAPAADPPGRAAAADPPVRDAAVYVGRISVRRGARDLLALARELGPQGPTVELIGTPDADVRDELERAHAAGEVRWHGFLPSDRAMRVVGGAVAGLSLLHDEPNYRVSLPTKVVEYLAAGVPAVSTPLPEAVALLEASGGGMVVPFGDVPAAADAVRQLAGDRGRARRLGAAGRAHVLAHLTWDREATVFLDALRRAAA